MAGRYLSKIYSNYVLKLKCVVSVNDGVKMDASKYIKYWNELRSGTSAPTRKQFNPMHLKKLLPYMTVIEHVPDSGIKTRLTGSLIDCFLEPYHTTQSSVINWPLDLQQQMAWKNLLKTLLTDKLAGIAFEANVLHRGAFFDTLNGAFLPFKTDNNETHLIGGIWPNQRTIKAYASIPVGLLEFIETKISILPAPDNVTQHDLKAETFRYFKMRDELLALAS